jgi:hypothetical protein
MCKTLIMHCMLCLKNLDNFKYSGGGGVLSPIPSNSEKMLKQTPWSESASELYRPRENAIFNNKSWMFCGKIKIYIKQFPLSYTWIHYSWKAFNISESQWNRVNENYSPFHTNVCLLKDIHATVNLLASVLKHELK